ncbi:hypothetical protein PILCRDRAFT_90899 [Piloderma croceum F 1598]|uniref:Uncharacterized protein n=1 Tax=Piloderma croceum (strain F 1598) TaxID=765440 RepID=A0A0C3AVG1_PILCF|nr:hypothetical protein PILCRDRAFT_90899 [Piloderma croceum F 1598]
MSGFGFYRTGAGFVTHLYNEQEVERAVWTKFGVSSESVDKLRAILAQVLRVSKDGNGEDEIVGLVQHETWHPEWDVWYDWTGDYYNEVFQALIEVVKQHGDGDEGWALARWEVYDTYAECVSGIGYSSWKGEGWSDGASWCLDASRTMGCKLGDELKALVEGRKIVTCSD